MKILKCKVCSSEVDIVGYGKGIVKQIECRSCGFTNAAPKVKEPEVVIIRRRPSN